MVALSAEDEAALLLRLESSAGILAESNATEEAPRLPLRSLHASASGVRHRAANACPSFAPLTLRVLSLPVLLVAIVLLSGVAGFAWALSRSRRERSSATSSVMTSSRKATKWDAHLCERCPVGLCDRGADGQCRTWDADSKTPGYHCRVQSCSEVPASVRGAGVHISDCWQHFGQAYYAVADIHFPCQQEALERNVTVSPVPANLQPAPLLDARSDASEAAADAGSLHATGPSDVQSDLQAMMLGVANSIAEFVRTHDPQLSAYWDVGNCGPAGDDHNSDWCGGLVSTPQCLSSVPVAPSSCQSGRARLSKLLGKGADETVTFEGCTFMYFAQYQCVPTTTTTSTSTTTTTSTTVTSTTTTTTRTATSTTSTTTTSSTSSSTATSVTTSTSTETTTTSKTTTTAAAEGKLMAQMHHLELSLLKGTGWSPEAGFGATCTSRFQPPAAPELATDHNGVHLPDVCFEKKGPHYVFIIGDWGGMLGPQGPKPANQRPTHKFVDGIDDQPQQRVAHQMKLRAATRAPDYILNGGDNFYWGGLDTACGQSAKVVVPTGQFEWNFEKIYTGAGLEDKPWLGVLGNHDYGGFRFDKGWDQLISYTWGPGGRWIMPAQYWRQIIRYPGFSVDYFFLDTNVFNAEEPDADPIHNICSKEHNPKGAACKGEGPVNVSDCKPWFKRLWHEQQRWLDEGLDKSTSQWQIVVTHFPPTWASNFWAHMAHKHGIDVIITGHIHSQQMHLGDDHGNFLRPTAWIVSGGGGGITSEDVPSEAGWDDQYGFFELTLTSDMIEVQGISHGGKLRMKGFVRQRPRATEHKEDVH